MKLIIFKFNKHVYRKFEPFKQLALNNQKKTGIIVMVVFYGVDKKWWRI
jgi:hypothetical protein